MTEHRDIKPDNLIEAFEDIRGACRPFFREGSMGAERLASFADDLTALRARHAALVEAVIDYQSTRDRVAVGIEVPHALDAAEARLTALVGDGR